MDHQPFIYVWFDATYVHVRENHQVVSKAVVIATGLRADGHREVLGVDVGDSENETFWTELGRGLKDRGLDGVRLVISDAHAGLRAAIRVVFQGASWQRCRVHAMRNLLSAAHHQHRQVIAALIPTDDAVFKILYLGIRNIANTRGGELGTGTQGWKQALNALTIAFPGRLNPNQ